MSKMLISSPEFNCSMFSFPLVLRALRVTLDPLHRAGAPRLPPARRGAPSPSASSVPGCKCSPSPTSMAYISCLCQAMSGVRLPLATGTSITPWSPSPHLINPIHTGSLLQLYGTPAALAAHPPLDQSHAAPLVFRACCSSRSRLVSTPGC